MPTWWLIGLLLTISSWILNIIRYVHLHKWNESNSRQNQSTYSRTIISKNLFIVCTSVSGNKRLLFLPLYQATNSYCLYLCIRQQTVIVCTSESGNKQLLFVPLNQATKLLFVPLKQATNSYCLYLYQATNSYCLYLCIGQQTVIVCTSVSGNNQLLFVPLYHATNSYCLYLYQATNSYCLYLYQATNSYCHNIYTQCCVNASIK